MPKSFTYILAALLIAGVIAAVIMYQDKSAMEPVACTMEAKICPDGSAVGRVGPNCEFAPCPTPRY